MNGAAPIWTEHLRYAAVSDIGMRRLNNQDATLQLPATDQESWQSRGHLFLVADGMGAHAAGELASQMAVQAVAHHYRKHPELSPPESLLRALRGANTEIHQRGQANSEFHNMGTTCSALLLLPQGALVGHVGDSRVYRLRGRTLHQLTFDHSLVWEMQAAGQMANRDLALSIPRNVITRSLGPQPSVQVDLEGPFDIQVGDRFLLCTDGLMAKLEDSEIGLLLAVLPPGESTQLLVDLANIRGGPDNITVVAVEATGSAITRRASRADPLIVGAELRPQRRVHPAVWIVFSVSLLVSAGLALCGQMLWSLATALVGLVSLPVAAWQRFAPEHAIPLTGGRKLGRGPYVTVDFAPPESSVEEICSSVREMLCQYDDSGLPDRSRIRACLDEAHSKVHEGEPTEAFRMLAVAARVFADALRRSVVKPEED
jgi:protein phosphatase